MFRTLTAAMAVAPQISPDDIAAAAELGVTMIINNRPDGEEPSAPQGEDIAAAAATAGIGYAAIPISHAGFSHAQIDAFDAAVAAAGGGPILAYCRSGTRSTHLWALARARAGDDVDGIVRHALNAGYDLTGLRPMLDALAGSQ
jgi:uncharacterized protein (TIGR01244 family)